MAEHVEMLKESVLLLYREPAIGTVNSFGEINIKNLVKKYQGLDADGMRLMMGLLVDFSKAEDLAASYISVGVMHALGMKGPVAEAYEWAKNKSDSEMFTSHFDIGISLADHFIGK
jgi:hypothetical protein